MLTKIYRKAIPLSFRTKIYDLFLRSILIFFRNFDLITKSKFVFLFQWILPKTEVNKALAFMGRYGLTSYPYPYMLEYRNINIIVEFDNEINLSYVLHNNKKLYFPITFNESKIIQTYRSLLIEQDIRAAHRYVESYSSLADKTLLDIGSAEGIFALDTIEFVKHVYLFEYEDYWYEPLKATFKPWGNKVTIIKKYINDFNDETNITIDDFLKGKQQDNLYLKMDIEGAEISALNGAANTLKNGVNIGLSVCTYHRPGDPEKISKLFGTGQKEIIFSK